MVRQSLPQRNPHPLSSVHKNLPAAGSIPGLRAPQGSYYLCPVEEKSDSSLSGPVLISACLAGRACRFDGGTNPDDQVGRLVAEGRAVLICPEEDGGLPTPRPPAEIVGGDGADVLKGTARVLTKAGLDVTEEYISGARLALESARAAGAESAILKARSPSCGNGCIYDGSFSRTPKEGDGVTAALLKAEGIEVVSEEDG